MSAWNLGYKEAMNECGSIYNNPFKYGESGYADWVAGYEARIIEETEGTGF